MLVSMYLAVLPADPLGPDVSAVLGGYRGVADGATLLLYRDSLCLI